MTAMVLAGASKKFIPGDLLIQVKPGVSKGEVDKLICTYGTAAGETEAIRVHRIKVPEHALEKIKQALAKKPNISFALRKFYCRGRLYPE